VFCKYVEVLHSRYCYRSTYVPIMLFTRNFSTAASCLSSMSSSDSSPHAQSMLTSTFSSPRMAPRPRIIPLYATTVPPLPRRPLAIHQNLRPKVSYHPYARHAKPPAINIPLFLPKEMAGDSLASTPGSPLTPIDNEPALGGSSQDVHLVFIPPPVAGVTVTTAGWHPKLIKDYRVCDLFRVPFVTERPTGLCKGCSYHIS
jgi:hypothetical protein